MTEPPDDRPRFLQELRPLHQPRPDTNGVTRPPGSIPAYARAAFAAELATLETTPEGRRNDQLNISAFNLGQLVAAGHLDEGLTREYLHGAGVHVGLTIGETSATVSSGMAAGMAQPRQVPELHSVQDIPEVSTIRPPGMEVPPEQEIQPVEQLYPTLNWHKLWADETEDDWILEPLLPARRLVALYSPAKVGKSLFMLELAVAISRGDKFLNALPDRPHRVLYVDMENDPKGDVVTRLQDMGYRPSDLDQLLYLSFPRLPYLDTAMGALQLIAVIDAYDVDVVVIDTISRIVSGEENDNDTWLNFYRHTGLALKARGVAAIRLDHTGKDQTKGMRGGSAKYGDVDAVWSMTPKLPDQFQLECTANRLPITRKLLTIHRATVPRLHHEAVGLADHIDAETLACVEQLRALGFPELNEHGQRKDGEPTALDKLRQAGKYPRGRGADAAGRFDRGVVRLAVARIKAEPDELDLSVKGSPRPLDEGSPS